MMSQLFLASVALGWGQHSTSIGYRMCADSVFPNHHCYNHSVLDAIFFHVDLKKEKKKKTRERERERRERERERRERERERERENLLIHTTLSQPLS